MEKYCLNGALNVLVLIVYIYILFCFYLACGAWLAEVSGVLACAVRVKTSWSYEGNSFVGE